MDADFREVVETPFSIGVGLHLHIETRSKNIVDFLKPGPHCAIKTIARDVDNYYRAVGMYRDNTLDEYFATIASAIISKSFDIIALRDSDFKEVPPFPFKF